MNEARFILFLLNIAGFLYCLFRGMDLYWEEDNRSLGAFAFFAAGANLLAIIFYFLSGGK